MALSNVSYLGNGSNRTYSLTFPYLSKAHVSVFINGIEDTTFTWLTSSSIQTTSVPALNVIVLIIRETPTYPLVDFVDGSTLTESLLDTSTLQSLYVVEESKDTATGNIFLDTLDNTLDAGNKRIKNVVNPVNPQDVATKQWAETAASSQVALATTQANLATTNGQTQVALATTQANLAALSATEAATVVAGTSAALANVTSKTSSTGSAVLPVGTTAQRDAGTPTGYLRYNATLQQFEGYGAAGWGKVGGGATGGGTNSAFYENDQTITSNYTITAGKNAMSAGPISIADGVTVTVPTGSSWVITG